jgi:NAD(P)-dependent dehydrogenase (short-subunit alcohol dehydrogenase family)
MTISLQGKVAIVTGANQGLGLEIARRYAAVGASLVVCARDSGSLAKAATQLQLHQSDGQGIEAIAADVSIPSDVERLVARALERFGKIDVLVNNAGIYGPMGATEDVDWREWVRAIEINLLGSVLMARAVVPAMKERRAGKIIQLSGGGATNPLPRISAYAASKAAVVRFAETLAEELRDFGIDVNSIAPGALNTRMLEQALAAGPEKVGAAFFEKSVKQRESGGAGLEQGASLAVFLASDASNGITGRLISALWDNWEAWPEHLAELASSDVYTLRRISGRDRGVDWGDK